jgi:Zn-dependent protease/CBS domain-containing protein
MTGSDSGAGRGLDSVREGLPLGSVRGIQIRMNWSAVVVFALIAVGLAAWQFPAADPRQARLTYALAGLLTTVVFLASLLAHEVAHSLVARHYGLRVNSITLWLFGGVSDLGGEAPSPAAEARIAGAGPLTSLLAGEIFIGLAVLVAASHPARTSILAIVYSALAYLGVINVALAVFNVIPAAPLDGGRLLRAVIWWRTHDRVKATVRADQAGQVFGTICVAGGLYAFFLTRDVSWVWIALVGWFLAGAATTEAQQAVFADRLRGVRAGQVMTPDPVTVPGSMTVSEFLTGYFYRAQHQAFPVTVDGQDTVTGLVTLDRIKRVSPHQRDHTRLADIACPLTDVARAAPGDSVADIVPRLTECADRRALVFSNGHLAGIITPSDITRMVDRLSPARPRLGPAS